MKLKTAYWDGQRWHEAGDECPEGHEGKAPLEKKQNAPQAKQDSKQNAPQAD